MNTLLLLTKGRKQPCVDIHLYMYPAGCTEIISSGLSSTASVLPGPVFKLPLPKRSSLFALSLHPLHPFLRPVAQSLRSALILRGDWSTRILRSWWEAGLRLLVRNRLFILPIRL